MSLRFNKNGKFKIMQITDIQEIPSVSPDTIKLLNSAILEEKPDLVVLTGDQIKGYGTSYKIKDKNLFDVVKDTLEILLKPIVDAKIPYAVTFGNHDRQVGISNAEQFEKIYKNIGNCIGEQAVGIDGGGTCNIPIYSSDGEKIVNNIYLFDSGTDAKGGGYEPFDEKIIKWYRATRDDLKKQSGAYVPSLVFQHIPMCEFDALNECGDAMAVFVGHDHKNSFVGRYKNIDLGYTQSSGFNTYGNRKKRGVRIIELDENQPSTYSTYTRTYDELVGDNVSRPLFDFLSSKAPETMDAAYPMIIKCLSILAIVFFLFAIIF